MSIESELAGLRRSRIDVEDAVVLGVGIADGYRRYESPVGEVVITFNVEGVSAVRLPNDLDELEADRRLVPALPPARWDRMIGRAIEEGRPRDLPLDLRRVGPFQRQILRLTGDIPRGEVRPYGWLAKEAGNPGAVRAVGSAMARNPVPLIVPCHRVVRTDGTIGNYSLGGPHNKVTLLELEGHDLDVIARWAAAGIRYVGSATTGIYCLPSCRNARRITDRHRVELHSRDQAEDGFRACEVCRP